MHLPDVPSPTVLAARLSAACAAAGAPPAAAGLGGRTLFALLYAGATADSSRWLRPNQVVRMSDEQARRTSACERRSWAEASSLPGFTPDGRRWYAENTRESVREVLTGTLLRMGAVVERPGLPRTSPAPRWALAAEFAAYLCAPDGSSDAALAHWLHSRTQAPPPGEAGRLAEQLRRAAAAAATFLRGHPRHAAASALAELSRQAGVAAEHLRPDPGDVP